MSIHGTSIDDAILCPLPAAYASQGGAWMYPCSGAVSFPELKSRSDVFDQFTDGSFPISFLSNFIHEATHHYCFDGIVGAVVLSARVAAQYGMNYRLLCQSADKEAACLENISCANRLAHSAALALLRPIAEGLAVYGECFAKPGSSEVMTPIPIYVTKLFRQRALFEQVLNSTPSDLEEFLDNERSKEGSQFATTLEAMRAQSAQHAIYWKGLEFVQSLIEILNEDLDDSDVALGFICSYVFHDCGLAARIARIGVAIGVPRAEETALDHAFNYLKDRLVKLRSDTDYRRQCLSEYVAGLLHGNRPESLDFQRGTEADVETVSNYTLYFGLESTTAQAIWPTNSKNRRNLKCGAFFADEITVSPKLGKIRCSFDEKVVEFDGLKSGFPLSFSGSGYQPVDGSPIVEFVFLDDYEPAIAFYNAHSLIGLLLRDGKTALASPKVDELYGQLSPAAAFLHDQNNRKAFWQPDSTHPCGSYFSKQVSKAGRMGLELCSLS